MSTVQQLREDDDDVWQRVNEHREALEICVEEDTPFEPYAKRLLEELDDRGLQ